MATRGGFIWINIAINILLETTFASPLYPQLITNGNGRNIRHLPCVSLRTGETGVCMFAFNCVKANGTHLGTCLDRFYFGSCCKLSDEPYVSPQDNAIDDLPSAQSTPGFLSTGKPIESNDIPDIKIKPKPNPESFPSSTSITSTQKPSTSTSTTKLPPATTKSPPKTTTKTAATKPVSISTPYTTTQPSVFSTFQTVQDSHDTYAPITVPTASKPFTTTTTTDRNPPGTRFPPRNATTPSPRPSTLKTTTLRPTTRPASPTKRPSTTKRPLKKPTSTTSKPFTNSTFSKPSKPSKPSSTTTFTKKPSDPVKTTAKPSKLPPASTPGRITTTEKPRPISAKPKPTTTSAPATRPPILTTTTTTTTATPTTSTTAAPTTLKVVSTEVPKTTESETTDRSSTPGLITWSSNSDDETTKFYMTTSSTPVMETTTTPTTTTTTTTVTTTTTTTTTTGPVTTTAIPSSSSTSSSTSATQLEEVTEPEWSPITTPDGWIMIQSPTTKSPGNEKEPVATSVPEPKPTKFPSTFPELLEPMIESSTMESSKPPVPTADSGASTTSTLKPGLDIEDFLEAAGAELNMSNFKQVCGRRLFPQSRIVGGEGSSYGKWPWQISLRQWRTGTFLHKCGATLLNENWAITAAHCVENVPPGDLLLRMGEHDLATENEPYAFQERRVQIVASHPQFDPRTFEYDLALLRFYEPLLPFQPNLLPICLPDDDEGYVGHTAFVTGWGRLYDEGPLPSVLQEVPVPVINNTQCESMYRHAGFNEHIPHIFICAGWKNGGFDSCEGDSGGPMVIQRPRDKRWILAGVISWGIGCAEPNQPGVYTRISEFREWINQILQF